MGGGGKGTVRTARYVPRQQGAKFPVLRLEGPLLRASHNPLNEKKVYNKEVIIGEFLIVQRRTKIQHQVRMRLIMHC